MTADKSERIQILCEQIEKEPDQDKLLKLVQELNQLLESQEPTGHGAKKPERNCL